MARFVPLTDPTVVATTLSSGNIDANLVAIVRGGRDMPALSDRQVVDAVAYHMPVPIVSVVGHEVDQPLIQDVAHHAFAAPTALGTWLADRAKGAIHAREAMALDHTRALEAMQRQLTDLTEVVTAAKVARLGILAAGNPPSEAARQRSPFWQTLRELGWVEGKNLAIERRDARGRYEQLPDLAAELVRLPIDGLVTPLSTHAALAAKAATRTIPIVFYGISVVYPRIMSTDLDV